MTKTDFSYIDEWHSATDTEQFSEPTIIHRDSAMLSFKMLYEELLEFKNAVQDEDLKGKAKLIEILDALVDVRYLLDGTIKKYGFQDIFDEALDLVHRNNMTKVVDGKVLRRSDGKIQKPENFEPVNLKVLFTKLKQAA